MDQKVLAVHRHAEIEVQVCRHCNGVWLTHDQLASRCVRSENLPAEARRAAAARPRHAAPRRLCSQCLVLLNPQSVEGIEIDVCPKCGGLWLDAGEFVAIHHWYMARPAKPEGAARRKKAAEFVEGGAHAADAVVDATRGLGEVIEFLCECCGSLLEGL